MVHIYTSRTRKQYVPPRLTNEVETLLEVRTSRYLRDGRVHVKNDEVVKSFDHDHVPDVPQVEEKELNHTMKHDTQNPTLQLGKS